MIFIEESVGVGGGLRGGDVRGEGKGWGGDGEGVGWMGEGWK